MLNSWKCKSKESCRFKTLFVLFYVEISWNLRFKIIHTCYGSGSPTGSLYHIWSHLCIGSRCSKYLHLRFIYNFQFFMFFVTAEMSLPILFLRWTTMTVNLGLVSINCRPFRKSICQGKEIYVKYQDFSKIFLIFARFGTICTILKTWKTPMVDK